MSYKDKQHNRALPKERSELNRERSKDAWKTMGRKLLGARQKAGLDITELAAQSLVHTRFIRAFEAGRDAGLVETYTRGYLKLLANHLKLSETEILSLYEEGCEQQLLDVQVADSSGATAPLEGKESSPASAKAMLAAMKAQVAQVFSEGLGAVVSLASQAAKLLRTRSSGMKSSPSSAKKPEASASAVSTSAVVASSRPTAILKNGSSWNTSSWSPVSWFGLVNGAVLSAVVVGVVITATVQMDQPETQNTQPLTSSEVAPLGELAVTAVSSEVKPEAELLPLNGDERRAALAMLDVDVTVSDDEPDKASSLNQTNVELTDASEPGNTDINQLVAFETVALETVAFETRTPVISNVDNQRSVRSVINVGNRDSVDRRAANAGALRLQDNVEPVGPGAEYMIAQYVAKDRLVISVYEDSWVDVRDAEGVRLYRALAKAGRRIDLIGKLPFSLHVGNAPGLGLELNGEYVPIEQYRSDNSARLTLADHP